MAMFFPVGFVKKHPVLSFFILVFFLNWTATACNVAGIFPALGDRVWMYEGHAVALFRGRRTLFNWTPNIAAFIVVSMISGMAGIRDLFGKFLHWRVPFRWWAAAVLGPVGICAAALGGHLLLGRPADFKHIHYLPAVFGIRFLFSLSLGSIGEEAGWRGFALPCLQERLGPLVAGVFLGIIWGVWHWPTLMIKQVSVEYIQYFFLSAVFFSVLLAWIYNAAGGSLLVAALFHNMINTVDVTVSHSFAAVVSRTEYMPVFTFVLGLAALIVIWQTRGRLAYVRSRT